MRYALPACLLMAALCLPAMFARAAPATPEQVIRLLHRDARSEDAGEDFDNSIRAATIYHRCGDYLTIDDARMKFMNDYMSSSWKRYRQALTDVHLGLTEKFPSDDLYRHIDDAIKERQENVAVEASGWIGHGEGCRGSYIQSLYHYFENVRKVAPPPMPPSAEGPLKALPTYPQSAASKQSGLDSAGAAATPASNAPAATPAPAQAAAPPPATLTNP